ncbi:hypothetical protein X736_14270 [Mesorhizobium sp. L2C089B000]|nr:hypothetical protein X736_14270 [Mesorhizobium sp. L2C089B000]
MGMFEPNDDADSETGFFQTPWTGWAATFPTMGFYCRIF